MQIKVNFNLRTTAPSENLLLLGLTHSACLPESLPLTEVASLKVHDIKTQQYPTETYFQVHFEFVQDLTVHRS